MLGVSKHLAPEIYETTEADVQSKRKESNCQCSSPPFQYMDQPLRQAHLEQLLQKRNTIRPFMHVVKRVEALLHLLRILLVLWIRRVGLLSYGCRRTTQVLPSQTRWRVYELRSVVLVVSQAEPFFNGDPATISAPDKAGELNDMDVRWDLGAALTAAMSRYFGAMTVVT